MEEVLLTARATLLGVVLNKQKILRGGHGYYRYYKYYSSNDASDVGKKV